MLRPRRSAALPPIGKVQLFFCPKFFIIFPLVGVRPIWYTYWLFDHKKKS